MDYEDISSNGNDKNTNINARESKLELLRIFSMILIIVHHFYYNNIILDYTNLNLNQFIVQILSVGGKIGVNCFVLITGYFMINSKFKLKKLLILMGEVWFYSITILLISTLLWNPNIGIKDLIKSIFPISYNHYWFITTYVVMYILSNYINKFLKNLNRKEYIGLIIILFVAFSIIPTFINGKIDFSNIDWFIFMYLVGAYIRLYPKNKKFNNKKIMAILIIAVILSILSVYILDLLYAYIKIDPLHFALPMNQILPLIISICIFLIFLNLNIKNNKTINRIASCMLGVYLIHTNILIRDIIWKEIFKVDKLVNSPYLVLYELLIVSLIFVICVIIDFIRQKTIERIYVTLIEKAKNLYNNKYKKRLNKRINKLLDEI